MFYSWGGGILQQYIAAGDVTPLGAPGTGWATKFLSSSLGAVTFNGQVYGVPIQGTQPVFFYYNKSALAQLHVGFPKTWPELLSDAAKVHAAGKSLIALGDLSSWEGLMYLEYLTDRIGGPAVFDAIQSGKHDAWSNPAVVGALTDIQDLVKAGAFQTGYDAVDYGSETDALVYSGYAPMQLMGDWDLSGMLGSYPSFVTKGGFGQAPFPAVPGGKGNPGDLEGNITEYLAVSSHITTAQQTVAEEFVESMFDTSAFAKTEVAAGEVPVISGSASLLRSSNLSSYLVQLYNYVQAAPNFQYSWDQALGSSRAQPMLTNLEKIFELDETPQQFVQLLDSSASGV
jgi:raffinose/stachyose/melibiose transport system substrate-binding protein